MRWPTFAPAPHALRAKLGRVPFADDRSFVGEKLAGVPHAYLDFMLSRYLEKHELEGRRAANLFCFQVEEMFPPRGVGLLTDDDELLRHAEACARQVKQMLGSIAAISTTAILARLQGIAKRQGVQLPKVRTLAAVVHRMTREHWWRRQLRRRLREVEHGAIQAGLVHVRAGVYVSEETFKRFRLQRERVARTLEETDAVNLATGEVRSLADLVGRSVSNPKVRRAEMMTRLRGMERYATAAGLVGMFYTITCPSRMHARLAPSGAPNAKYDATSPNTAQRHLVKLWARIRAALERDGIEYFGLRVAEPHHDATPHWHMLAFVRAGDEPQLTDTLRRYALAADSDEAGAAEHRFALQRIDPAKGGAVAYVAKYVAKNIDGEHVGIDLEGGAPAITTAQRIEAWARTWRIRQFQFFGTPSVVPWRELRRLRVLPEGAEADWSALWAAADAGDWCDYMQQIRAGALDVSPVMELRESASYPGELIERVRGVRLHQADRELQLVTRDGEWVIRWGEGLARSKNGDPWTRVNNCTPSRRQGLTEDRATDFSALIRKLEGQPDFSLAILTGNLANVGQLKQTAVREESRAAIRRALQREASNEDAAISAEHVGQRRAKHSAAAPVLPFPAEQRHGAMAQAIPPHQGAHARHRHGLDGALRRGQERAPQGAPSNVGIESVENRRSPGAPPPGERLATEIGLDADGCREK